MHALLLIALATVSSPQNLDVEKRALDVAQQVSVRELDKSLGDTPFADWFKSLVGDRSAVVWHVTDCGEGDGGRGGSVRDLPLCGEVVANLTGGKKAVVQVFVGSRSKGVSSAALWSAAILDGNDVQFFKTLPELAATIDQTLKR
jgi:hypothetical protein